MLMQTEVKAVAELIPGLSDSRGRARNWIVLVSGSPFPLICRWQQQHTFGTTSLNHGVGESNSANQSAVAEPTSLERLCISHSGEHVSCQIHITS